MEQTFKNYEKQESGTRVLLLYLLLDGAKVDHIQMLEETAEERAFGLKLKKTYAITEDHIDTEKIERAMAHISCPVICNREAYEYYADAPYIYVYKRREESLPLLINDMGLLSKTMVISEEEIIADHFARDFMSPDCVSGFPFFQQYVLTGAFTIGKWTVTYQDNTFTIQYEQEIIYRAIEIDKTSTYKMVIYLIERAAIKEAVTSDNFTCEKYRRKAVG